MRDNQIVQLVLPLLTAGFVAEGHPEVVCMQNYQPTQQGRPSPPTVMMNKILDHRHGSPGIKNEFDSTSGVITRTKTEIIESHWQFDCVSVEDPTDVDALTTADYLKIAASIMQDTPFLSGLYAGGAQALRIQDIRTTFVQNDRDQYEKNPSFDVIITHKDVTVTTSPIAVSLNFKLRRV